MKARLLRVGGQRGLLGTVALVAALLGAMLVASRTQAAIEFDVTAYPVGTSSGTVRSIVSDDLDNDGDLDVVTGNAVGEITAWENDGSPYDGVWTCQSIGAMATGDCHLALADLDHDGWMDVVSGDSAGQVLVWRNDSTPFADVWASNVVASVTSSAVVVVADFDKDSWMDIACAGIAYGGPGDVTILQNDETPFDGPWSELSLYSGYTLGGIATGDLDDDGYEDIIFTLDEYDVAVLGSDGTPFDGGWTYCGVGSSGYGMVTGLAVGDFDSDGYPDIATACGFLPTEPQWVWLNDGTPFDGGWVDNVYGSTPAPTVAAADFDVDGHVDLVTGSHVLTEEPGGRNYSELVAWGNDGTPFADVWSRNDIGSCLGAIVAVAVTDLDADGDLDIVSGSSPEAEFGIAAWTNLAVTTPVEGVVYALATLEGTVLIRWSVASLSAVEGFNVYRAASPEGPFSKVNAEQLPAESPSVYEDTTVWPGTTFWYELRSILAGGGEETVGGSAILVSTAGTLVTTLHRAFPNPFADATTVLLDIASDVEHASVSVFSVRGQLVRTLVNGPLQRGRHSLRWDGLDGTGQAAAAGVYLLKLDAGNVMRTRKVLLAR